MMAFNHSGILCSFEDLSVGSGDDLNSVRCGGNVVALASCRDPGTQVLRLYYRELSKHPVGANTNGGNDGESQSLIQYEFQLIMARAGLFYEGTEGLNICMNHRDRLGWRWERPDKSCYHPEHVQWCGKEVQPYVRTHGHNVVTLDLSKKLARDCGVLLPVGTGICEVCLNKEKAMDRTPCEMGEAFKEVPKPEPPPLPPRTGKRGRPRTRPLRPLAIKEDPTPMAYPVSLMKVGPIVGYSLDGDGNPVDNSQFCDNEINNVLQVQDPLGVSVMEAGPSGGTGEEHRVEVQEPKVKVEEPRVKVNEPRVEDEGPKVKTKSCNIVFHVCTTCLQGFETEEGLDEHRKTHEEKVPNKDGKVHLCEICSEKFDDYVDLCSHHFLKHHLDQQDKTLEDRTVHVTPGVRGRPRKRDLEELESEGSDAKRPNIVPQGDFIGSVLTGEEMTAMFEFQLPSVQLNLNFSAWDHTCRFCLKSFVEYEPFRLHLKQHRIDANIYCPICGDEFTELRPLYDHMKVHEKESSIKLRDSQPKFCDHCSYIFPECFIKTRGCLIETPDRSEVAMCYVCVFCIASCTCTMDFPPDGFLPVPFKCEYSQCCAVFQLENDMARHSLYNHDECHICQHRIPRGQMTSLAERIELYENHMRVNHKCPKCGKVFKKQKDKTRHILEEHVKEEHKKTKSGRRSNRRCYSCGAKFVSIVEKAKHIESYCPVLKKKSGHLQRRLEGLVLPENGDEGEDAASTFSLHESRGVPKKLYKPFVCLFCMNLVKTKLDFDVHRVTCKPILKCTSCDTNIRESDGYDFHARSCKTCRTLSCVMCRKYSGEPEAAFDHARLCKKKTMFMMACCVDCKQRVASYDAARLHKCAGVFERQKNEKEKSENVKRGKKGKKVETDVMKMLESPDNEEGSKPNTTSAISPGQYRCRYCNLNLPRKVSSHELYCTYNTNAKSRRMIYGCDYCNIKFHTRNERDMHLMTCLRGKCDYCHENFGNEGHRIMHMRGCHYKPKSCSFR